MFLLAISFKEEYLTLLRKFDIAFDDKYVFEFIDWGHFAPDGAQVGLYMKGSINISLLAERKRAETFRT